jgi:hypothetical protein
MADPGKEIERYLAWQIRLSSNNLVRDHGVNYAKGPDRSKGHLQEKEGRKTQVCCVNFRGISTFCTYSCHSGQFTLCVLFLCFFSS